MSDWPKVEQRDRLLWAAVDGDGTLWRSMWSPKNPTAKPGPPILENIRKCQELVDAGWKIVVHTSRPWSEYEAIEEWCTEHLSFPIRAIVCGKLLAAIYVDDRAVNASQERWI